MSYLPTMLTIQEEAEEGEILNSKQTINQTSSTVSTNKRCK